MKLTILKKTSVGVFAITILSLQRAALAQAPAESDRTLIDRVVLSGDWGALPEIVAEGAALVPQIEVYLAHKDANVRARALTLLCRIPEAGASSVARSLRSPDQSLKSIALTEARPFLADEHVRSPWIECFAQPIEDTNAHEIGYTLLRSLDPELRGIISQELLPKVLRTLDSYSARSARVMVLVIGELAPPEDQSAIRRLTRLRAHAEGDWPARWQSPWGIEQTQKDRQGLLVALDFALANLGGAAEFEQYSIAVVRGDPEVRAARLQLLEGLRPVPRALRLAALLLDDRAPLTPVPLSHLRQPIYRRACDFATDAIGAWFPESPVKTHFGRVYTDEELTQAHEWLNARLSK